MSEFIPNDIPKKLNLGCGAFTLSGYINVDIQPPADVIGDFTAMQFSAVTEVVMSHVLEHLSWQRSTIVLKQVHSWMIAGGRVTVEVPDMDVVMKRAVYDQDAEIAIYGIQSAPGEFHRAGFTLEKLTSVLTGAGFTVEGARCFLSEHEARVGLPCLEAIGVAL